MWLLWGFGTLFMRLIFSLGLFKPLLFIFTVLKFLNNMLGTCWTHTIPETCFFHNRVITLFSFVTVVDFLFSLFSVHRLTLLSLSTLFIGYCISWNNALIFMHSYCLSPRLFSERFSQSYFPTLLMNFNSRYWSFVFPVLFRSPLIVYFFLTSCYCFMKTASSFSSFRISTLVFSVRRRWCGLYFCFLQFPLVWLFRSFACIGDFHYLVIWRSWLDSLCVQDGLPGKWSTSVSVSCLQHFGSLVTFFPFV